MPAESIRPRARRERSLLRGCHALARLYRLGFAKRAERAWACRHLARHPRMPTRADDDPSPEQRDPRLV